MTTTDTPKDDLLWCDDKPVRRPVGASLKEMARYWWRQLTSMRTALILLFLLALASVPGSLLPQRNLSPSKVRQYLTAHPDLGPWLSRLGFFNVFSSPWYAAIYLLLFISLIGCLVPRIAVYLRAVRAQPPHAPRRLSRLSEYAEGSTDRPTADVLDDAEALLKKKRWRVVRRGETLSAEKGYLQEAGNLIFHVSLLALLIALAAGKLNGYEASRIAVEDEGFCNTQMSYDSFTGGPLVDGSDLVPMCIDLKSFDTVYDADLTPARFVSKIDYSTTVGGASTNATIESNEPLRVDGVRAYVTGHGYAPVFTITMPDGTVRTEQAPFLPVDQKTFASEGALKIDTGDAENSLALQGFLAPTSQDSASGIVSTDPRLLNPKVALFVYQGYTGLDTGTPQSVYALDQEVIDSGLLKKVASVNLAPGESTVLADGTTIKLDKVVEWAAFQVSHDPGQVFVLGAAVILLGSLMMTLLLRRRRLWVRVVESGDTRQIEVGGLAHSGQHAFTDEFAAIGARIVSPSTELDDEEKT